MPIEKSAGTVVFKKEKGKILYLLLKYSKDQRRPNSYWDFPKGHIEKGESLADTARRETLEETGLKNIKFIPGFKKTIKYFFKFEGKIILKFVTFFLCQSGSGKAKISSEHADFKWMSFKEAANELTFKNAKNILNKAEKHLKKYASSS
ncbi:MAG: bis(5'-nucleosyl)-tetraphosphatase [Candidatus Nealsonbacteria bacterium]